MLVSLNKGKSELLGRANVGIAGLGGIGSHVAALLARAGIKNLTLVDYDKVEYSNLNRQYYFIDQIGEKKVEALSATLKRINPSINCSFYDIEIVEDNIEVIFNNCDIIVEALDRGSVKSMFSF